MPAGRFYFMIEVELQIPDCIHRKTIVRIVEQVCMTNGVTCTLKGTLAKYPGSIHWHLKRGKQKGTLEVTWWEREHRLWFKVAENRTSAWIKDSIPILKDQIEKSV